MLNWTQEDIDYLNEVMFNPFAKVFAQEMAKQDDKSFEVYKKMLTSVVNAISARIRKLDYNANRDRMFFMTLICNELKLDRESLDNLYKEYCEQFDKLNKHLLTEE